MHHVAAERPTIASAHARLQAFLGSARSANAGVSAVPSAVVGGADAGAGHAAAIAQLSATVDRLTAEKV